MVVLYHPGHERSFENPTLFVQIVLSGLQLGFVYALIALGYTMVYGIVKLINFAHGDVFMVGAFVSYYAVSALRLARVAGSGLPRHARRGSRWSIGSLTVMLLVDGGLHGRWRSSSSGWPTSRCAMRPALPP